MPYLSAAPRITERQEEIEKQQQECDAKTEHSNPMKEMEDKLRKNRIKRVYIGIEVPCKFLRKKHSNMVRDKAHDSVNCERKPPFASFPFNSPPMRHRVPSRSVSPLRSFPCNLSTKGEVREGTNRRHHPPQRGSPPQTHVE